MGSIAPFHPAVERGVRPFSPFRDARSVIDLLSVAFGDQLGPDGEQTLMEMRWFARLGPLVWWLWPVWGGRGFPPGFVWVEQGRVRGNVSVRRAVEWGGFLIGNVAVHPDWRRRGIAKALMETALELIARQDGQWVGLEVRADNSVARRLYENLGFVEVGRTLHLLRPVGLAGVREAPACPGLRRARSLDSASVANLAQRLIPAGQRPLLDWRREDYRLDWEHTVNCWLAGRFEVWWVIEERSAIVGAVRARREYTPYPDRLEVLVAPEYRGELEEVLVQRGMVSLHHTRRKMLEAIFPYPNEPLVRALEGQGFRQIRVLIQMRRNLKPGYAP